MARVKKHAPAKSGQRAALIRQLRKIVRDAQRLLRLLSDPTLEVVEVPDERPHRDRPLLN